jgi:hypothetical protein
MCIYINTRGRRGRDRMVVGFTKSFDIIVLKVQLRPTDAPNHKYFAKFPLITNSS